jgi:hypothetical protein
VTTIEIDDAALDEFLARTTHQFLEDKAQAVESTAKRLLVLHGTGRLYTTRFYRDREGRLRRGGRRVPHQASAPGFPPASDTGRLLSSIHHEVVGAGTDLEARIGSDVNYALYLELGTRYMLPRPFLRPALRAVESGLQGLPTPAAGGFFGAIS